MDFRTRCVITEIPLIRHKTPNKQIGQKSGVKDHCLVFSKNLEMSFGSLIFCGHIKKFCDSTQCYGMDGTVRSEKVLVKMSTENGVRILTVECTLILLSR